MTDTKEPTPLTAASLANIELEIKAREGNGETRQDDPLFLRLLATIAELQRELEGLREHDTSVTAKLKDVTEVLDWFSSVAVGREDESLWQFVASLIWDRYYARQLYAAAKRINELRKEQLEGYRQALESIRDNRNAQPGVPCSGSCVDKAARVLAGKGQCPKCEGRGFIRTMVDGQRDSEPCSYCRMSGLAGKEAQGG